MKIGWLIAVLLCSSVVLGQDFKQQQLKYERVRTAFDEKWSDLSKLLDSKGVNPNKFKLFIRVFKAEQRLETWVTGFEKEHFMLLKTYKIAASSGELGPKRKQGDYQVPEGFYHIDRFNPTSSFYLSLGVNYPNESDRILGKKNLGGDIFIHGSDVTIGCVPLTDDKIKEVYALAVQAKSSGQAKIYVHIFPLELTKENIEKYKNNSHYQFWKSIEKGYIYFNQEKKIPVVGISKTGEYFYR
jgi:murein L,D-transpeptidase YafK